MSQPRHSEAAFEAVIEAQLLTNGDVAMAWGSFDRKRATFPETVTERIITPLKERRAAAVMGKINVQGEIREGSRKHSSYVPFWA